MWGYGGFPKGKGAKMGKLQKWLGKGLPVWGRAGGTPTNGNGGGGTSVFPTPANSAPITPQSWGEQTVQNALKAIDALDAFGGSSGPDAYNIAAGGDQNIGYLGNLVDTIQHNQAVGNAKGTAVRKNKTPVNSFNSTGSQSKRMPDPFWRMPSAMSGSSNPPSGSDDDAILPPPLPVKNNAGNDGEYVPDGQEVPAAEGMQLAGAFKTDPMASPGGTLAQGAKITPPGSSGGSNYGGSDRGGSFNQTKSKGPMLMPDPMAALLPSPKSSDSDSGANAYNLAAGWTSSSSSAAAPNNGNGSKRKPGLQIQTNGSSNDPNESNRGTPMWNNNANGGPPTNASGASFFPDPMAFMTPSSWTWGQGQKGSRPNGGRESAGGKGKSKGKMLSVLQTNLPVSVPVSKTPGASDASFNRKTPAGNDSSWGGEPGKTPHSVVNGFGSMSLDQWNGLGPKPDVIASSSSSDSEWIAAIARGNAALGGGAGFPPPGMPMPAGFPLPDFAATPKAANAGDVDGSPIHEGGEAPPNLKRPRADSDETVNGEDGVHVDKKARSHSHGQSHEDAIGTLNKIFDTLEDADAFDAADDADGDAIMEGEE